LCPRCVPRLFRRSSTSLLVRFRKITTQVRCTQYSLDPRNGRAQLFSATLCCVLNNLSDLRWPPKYLRSLERHENRGWESWVYS
jgi:hypothetical protein